MTRWAARGAMPLRITTAAEAAARDVAAITAGVPSFELMVQAGTQSAAAILRTHAHRTASGVDVYAGTGNNGGDASVVAAQLARAGVAVRLYAVGTPRTEDAQRAHALALTHGVRQMADIPDATPSAAHLVVDGLLGTGHRGALRAPIATCTARIAAARARGAVVLALDLPSGLDATTGEVANGAVMADETHAYGTVKRGHLFARAHTGRLLLLDIGLGAAADLPDAAWDARDISAIAASVPAITWDAHKRTRGHLALLGGATGMAGALVLATRAAVRSGIGLALAWLESGVPVMQGAVPQAIARDWSDVGQRAAPLAHALAVGPGLGRTDAARQMLRHLRASHASTPAVLDADALTLLAEAEPGNDLAAWAATNRPVVATPHLGEFARLLGTPVATAWEARAAQLQALAAATGATVLLKGAPTLIATSGHRLTVVAHGTAVLATGGSGDILTGIVGTLLAQGMRPHDAAVLGATVHGRAAERVAERWPAIRGSTVDDVLEALPEAWDRVQHPVPLPPGVLAEWPAVTHA